MEEILNELIGKKRNYKGKEIIINKHKKVNGNYVIFSDKQTYNFLESEIEKFVLDLKDTSIQVKKHEIKPVELENISTQENNLSVILFETIKKVKIDKDYINQANAICNVVSQMINVRKLELLIKKQLK